MAAASQSFISISGEEKDSLVEKLQENLWESKWMLITWFMLREGESLVGKLQANLLGAKFMLMGGTTKSRTRSQSSDRSSSDCSSSGMAKNFDT